MGARLLTESAAAEHLSIPKACMKRIVRGRVLIDGRVRWDRVALDAWLDELSGMGVQSEPANCNMTEAEAALERFLSEDQERAARRPSR